MSAFDLIYDRYSNRVFGYVLRYIKNRQDAEEILQDVFVKIWENRDRINSSYSFESFIFTIAYNRVISLLRKRISEKRYLEHLLSMKEIAEAPDVIGEMDFLRLHEQVESLIQRLSPRQREVFNLCRKEGLTHDEVAKRLNISVNTVRNHMVSALAFIKSHLNSGMMVNAFYFSLFF